MSGWGRRRADGALDPVRDAQHRGSGWRGGAARALLATCGSQHALAMAGRNDDHTGRIVVPIWALELRPSALALLLEHEHEHIRARDHWLLAGGLGLLLLFPINPFLWWQFSRLKLAIEMDCDARVLSGRQDVRSYAALLLDVGRRCRSSRLVFAAFAAPPVAGSRPCLPRAQSA